MMEQGSKGLAKREDLNMAMVTTAVGFEHFSKSTTAYRHFTYIKHQTHGGDGCAGLVCSRGGASHPAKVSDCGHAAACPYLEMFLTFSFT